MGRTTEAEFDEFVARFGNRLWQSLVPIAGPEAAWDASVDALIHGWNHWDRVRDMDNPEGYLYVIARRNALRMAQPRPILPMPEPIELPEVEPNLARALDELSEMQRQVVYLVEGFGWGLTDVSRMLGVSVSTVRNHLARGLARLRQRLKVEADA